MSSGGNSTSKTRDAPNILSFAGFCFLTYFADRNAKPVAVKFEAEMFKVLDSDIFSY